MGALRNVRLHNWVQVAYKLGIILWMVVLTLYTPALSSALLGGVLILVASVTSMGALIAIVGLVMSCQPGVTGRKGLGIEIAGLWSMMLGPVVYFATQIGIASTTEGGWNLRAAFVCVLGVVILSILGRVGVVIHRWRLLKAPVG